jgi:hypothetical protein
MNLQAQIGLMTVPQEFTRLCNAVLTAEYGDDYLPIDDDRSDRGNDGYLKSEKRMFAAHCFKRIQNQSIDAAIRNKMIGDLGKAIALKHEGIWDITSWTFVCNYKISEAIAARLIEIGQGTDIDVSWRGPDELATSLQKHKSVLGLFPSLQGSKISEQLADIQSALGALSSVAEDEAPLVTPPSRAPRTAEEQRNLLLSRPPAWEYLLFAGVLCQGSSQLESKWRDHELYLPRGPRKHLDVGTAPTYLSHAFSDLRAVIEPVNRLFERSAQEQAFGPPGEPGDPARIEHFARHIINMYEEMLDWAAAMRNLDVPESLKAAVELASRFVDQPISEFRDFFEHTVAETDRIPAHLAAPDPEPLTIELNLVVTVEDRLLGAFQEEMERATHELADNG